MVDLEDVAGLFAELVHLEELADGVELVDQLTTEVADLLPDVVVDLGDVIELVFELSDVEGVIDPLTAEEVDLLTEDIMKLEDVVDLLAELVGALAVLMVVEVPCIEGLDVLTADELGGVTQPAPLCPLLFQFHPAGT